MKLNFKHIRKIPSGKFLYETDNIHLHEHGSLVSMTGDFVVNDILIIMANNMVIERKEFFRNTNEYEISIPTEYAHFTEFRFGLQADYELTPEIELKFVKGTEPERRFKTNLGTHVVKGGFIGRETRSDCEFCTIL